MHGRAWLSAHFNFIGMHLLLDFSSIQMHHGYVDLSSRTLLTCNCRILDYVLWVLLAGASCNVVLVAAVIAPKMYGLRVQRCCCVVVLMILHVAKARWKQECWTGTHLWSPPFWLETKKGKKKGHLFFPSFLFQANMTWFQFDSEFHHQKFFSVWLT